MKFNLAGAKGLYNGYKAFIFGSRLSIWTFLLACLLPLACLLLGSCGSATEDRLTRLEALVLALGGEITSLSGEVKVAKNYSTDASVNEETWKKEKEEVQDRMIANAKREYEDLQERPFIDILTGERESAN